MNCRSSSAEISRCTPDLDLRSSASRISSKLGETPVADSRSWMKFSNSCCLAVSIGPSVWNERGTCRKRNGLPSSRSASRSREMRRAAALPCSRGDAFGMELDAVDRRVSWRMRHHGAVFAPRVGDQAAAAGRAPPANDSGSPRTARAGRRTGRCRHAGPARPCRAPARSARRPTRRPAQSPGGQGRRRAAGCRRSMQAAASATEMPASSGAPGPGEIRIPSRTGSACASSTRQRVVALDGDLRPERDQIVDQHEGEAVDIVDDQDARAGHRPPQPLLVGAGDPLLGRRDRIFVALDALVGLHRREHLLRQVRRTRRCWNSRLGLGDQDRARTAHCPA